MSETDPWHPIWIIISLIPNKNHLVIWRRFTRTGSLDNDDVDWRQEKIIAMNRYVEREGAFFDNSVCQGFRSSRSCSRCCFRGVLIWVRRANQSISSESEKEFDTHRFRHWHQRCVFPSKNDVLGWPGNGASLFSSFLFDRPEWDEYRPWHCLLIFITVHCIVSMRNKRVQVFFQLEIEFIISDDGQPIYEEMVNVMSKCQYMSIQVSVVFKPDSTVCSCSRMTREINRMW